MVESLLQFNLFGKYLKQDAQICSLSMVNKYILFLKQSNLLCQLLSGESIIAANLRIAMEIENKEYEVTANL